MSLKSLATAKYVNAHTKFIAMDPIIQSFDGSKEQIMDTLATALNQLDMPLHGRSDRLGLISISQESGPFLYAHFVEQSESTTDVSIAPGLSNLKDRDNSMRPDSTIQRIIKRMEAVNK